MPISRRLAILSLCLIYPPSFAKAEASSLLPSKALVELAQSSHVPRDSWVGEYRKDGFDFFVYISLVEHDFSEYELSRERRFRREPTVVSGIASGGFMQKRGLDSPCQIEEEDHTPVSGYKSADGKIHVSAVWTYHYGSHDRSFDYFLDEREKGDTWKVRINYAWHHYQGTAPGSVEITLYRTKDLKKLVVSD